MNCVIIDADRKSLKTVEGILNDSGLFSYIITCSKPGEALKAVANNFIDVIFIDIDMPGMDGIGFLKGLTYSAPHLIVMGQKKEAAADAFEFAATDFILKPVSHERLMRAIGRMVKRDDMQPGMKNMNGSDLFVRMDGTLLRTRIRNISHIESRGDYIQIHEDGKKISVRSTLKGILRHLPLKDFVQVHKSYVVRLDRIEAIEDGKILIDGTRIPISSTYREELMKRIKIIPK
jgi:two-component system LytT family response regulator